MILREEIKISSPPMYVSGKFHLGHAMSYIIADVFRKYFQIKGKSKVLSCNDLWNAQGKPLEKNLILEGVLENEENFVKCSERNIKKANKNKRLLNLTEADSHYKDFSDSSRQFTREVLKDLIAKKYVISKGEELYLDVKRIIYDKSVPERIEEIKVNSPFVRKELLKTTQQLSNTYPITKPRLFATKFSTDSKDYTINPLFDLSLFGRLIGQSRDPLFMQINGPDVLVKSNYLSILTSLAYDNQLPFERLFIHPILKDINGGKFTKNNMEIINIPSIVQEYGAFALRYCILSSARPTSSVRLNQEYLARGRKLKKYLEKGQEFLLCPETEINRDLGLEARLNESMDKMDITGTLRLLEEKLSYMHLFSHKNPLDKKPLFRQFNTLNKYFGVMF